MRNKSFKISISIGLIFVFIAVLVPVVKAEPYGWSPQVDFSNQGTPTCTDSKPDKAPILLQPNHPALPQPKNKGEVRLQWFKVPGATGYNVYYGLSPKNYIFAALNLPDTDNFTVGFLANRTYYFAVQARKGCAASDLSNEWAGRPKGATGYTLAAATGFVPVQTQAVTTYTAPETTSEVQGVATEPTEEVSPPAEDTFEPPVEYQPPVAPITPPTPAKLTLWQKILKFFGLYR